MCGILAWINDIEYVEMYFDTLDSRGPDSSKLLILNQVALGIKRLAINGGAAANQPFQKDGVILIANAEIYNHREIEKRYKYPSLTGSDCEVLLHLYLAYGINELLEVIDAEFAFIIYDTRTDMMYVARDTYGVRPLYWGYDDDRHYFASEMKAIPENALVKHFPPGHVIAIDIKSKWNQIMWNDVVNNRMTIKHTQFSTKCSFELSKWAKEPRITKTIDNYYVKGIFRCNNDTYAAARYQIRDLLTAAVKSRLMSDRPIGCLLSGGLDSSLVAALAVKHAHLNAPITCFSIGVDENSVDIIAAKQVAAYIGAEHHIVHFTVEEGFAVLEDVIVALETYDVTTIRAGIVNYLLCKYISENTDIKVLLSGSGADEVFCGYQYSKMINNADILAADSVRLLDELHMFDNLRDDRAAGAFGLEVRVPFLCPKLVNYVATLDPKYRLCNKTIEKRLLRDAFIDEDKTILNIHRQLLPDNILMRHKEAFSNGVSAHNTDWYEEMVDKYINPIVYNLNTTLSNEKVYYRQLFNKHFAGRDNVISHYWMPPAICGHFTDPSARVLPVYENSKKLNISKL